MPSICKVKTQKNAAQVKKKNYVTFLQFGVETVFGWPTKNPEFLFEYFRSSRLQRMGE